MKKLIRLRKQFRECSQAATSKEVTLDPGQQFKSAGN
jgi:hypothetical protein